MPSSPITLCAGDLSWVDQFIRNIRPYVFVRTEDNVLILRPNRAHKLNAWGARVLKALLDGHAVKDVVAAAGGGERASEIGRFLCAVKSALEGHTDRLSGHPGVDHVPFDMRFSEYPVLSEVALTYRCNLRCAFCYARCGDGDRPPVREMAPRQVARVLDMLYHEARVPSVSFTGGEPTLVRELPRYVHHAARLGMRVNLITNGTLVDPRLARRLADSGLHSAQVSLEGVQAGTHDRLVGCTGAFERSLAGAKNLAACGIATHTNTTITAANAAEAPSLPDFVRRELGFDRLSMNLVIPSGSVTDNAGLVVHYSEIGALLEQVRQASAQAGVEFMWYSPVPMCLYNTVAEGLGNRGCAACDGLLSVAPDGSVLPCASVIEPVGNLLSDGFAGVWRSARACAYRDKTLAPDACRGCDDFHICNGACLLYWRALGEEELAATGTGQEG